MSGQTRIIHVLRNAISGVTHKQSPKQRDKTVCGVLIHAGVWSDWEQKAVRANVARYGSERSAVGMALGGASDQCLRCWPWARR